MWSLVIGFPSLSARSSSFVRAVTDARTDIPRYPWARDVPPSPPTSLPVVGDLFSVGKEELLLSCTQSFHM